MELNEDGSPKIPKTNEQGASPSAQTTGDDWEKRYKDTQAFATQKNQALIDFAKAQVERDPTSIKLIPDKTVQKKILQEKWNVDSIDELETLFPEVLKPKDNKNNEEDEDKYVALEKKVKLMEYKETKTKTKEAIDEIKKTHKDLVSTIDGFDEKLAEEMKYLSSELSPQERAQKAFKILTTNIWNIDDVYAMLQWVTIPKKTEEPKLSADKLKEAQEGILSYMGIKTK